MFATQPALAPHAGAGARQVGVSTGVSTATPHQLVPMLFDGFDEALVQALGALRDGAVETNAAPSAAPRASSTKACAPTST